MTEKTEHKSGYVSIIGKPNVGKSTLMNCILGEKLSIVSSKPQTTRKNIFGIYNDENTQIVFIDTPGILKPEYLLQKKMYEYIINSLNESDLILFLVEALKSDFEKLKLDTNFLNIFSSLNKPKILAINKIDTLENKNEVLTIIEKYDSLKLFNEIVPISAINGDNVDELVKIIKGYLPISPPYYNKEDISNAPVRFFIAEIIREKIFEKFRDEIPYSTEVVVDEYIEREGQKDYISVIIIVEKKSQRGIIIGKNGSALKEVGEVARKEIELFLGKGVYLKTYVKVRENWRNNEKLLKSFGY